jgi:hypothetical protein
MKYLLLPIFILILSHSSEAQCYNKNQSFGIDETLHYKIIYNWGKIWVHAANVSFNTSFKTYNARPVYHFKSKGYSLDNFDWLYKVRDSLESYLDTFYLKPLWFESYAHENRFKGYEHYVFNYQRKEIFSIIENSKIPLKHDTLKLLPCTSDPLSAVYYIRNLDYSKMKINDQMHITFVMGNKVQNLLIRYLGKDVIATREGKVYRCIKIESELNIDDIIFKKGESVKIWLTDDNNHIPVLVDAKILIGSVKAVLDTTMYLRSPFEARVK